MNNRLIEFNTTSGISDQPLDSFRVLWRKRSWEARGSCGPLGAQLHSGRQIRCQLLSLALVISLSQLGVAQLIVAHRGASADAPENTLAAFNEAWRQGADGIEGDFYFTADKQIVCIHDKDTERTGRRKLSVATSTLAELRALEYGSWKAKEFSGEPLPTFAEVAATLPEGKLFVIELKTGPEIVPLLQQEIERLELDAQQLLIIAFDAETVAAAKKRLPGVRAHWLTSYKQNPVTRAWRPSLDKIATTLQQCQADGLGCQAEAAVVTPQFVQQLRRKGMQEFHVWTVDDPADARYFSNLGAVGITTNQPANIRKALKP